MSMKFLYVGSNMERLEKLGHALNRANTVLEKTETPELAFFKVLHEEIAALLIDLSEGAFNGEEVLSSLESLDRDLEVVLIARPEDLNRYSRTLLRSCCGYLTPDLDMACNAIALHQLTDRITLKGRLESLKNTSIIDGLTQLYNHAYFQQRLDEEIQMFAPSGEPITLVLLDIDNFKVYNDTNGHPAGDRVLKKVASVLSNAVRKFDLTARYGGEEFVMVFPGTGLSTGLSVTERIRKRIVTTDFEFGHLQPLGFVSASFGVAVLDYHHIKDKQELIKKADEALYKSKHNGKNCIWFRKDGVFHPYG